VEVASDNSVSAWEKFRKIYSIVKSSCPMGLKLQLITVPPPGQYMRGSENFELSAERQQGLFENLNYNISSSIIAPLCKPKTVQCVRNSLYSTKNHSNTSNEEANI